MINGQLKNRFRANDKTHFNVTLSHTMDDLRISAALLNKFFTEYSSDRNNETIIVNNMMSRLHTPNRLESVFLEHHIDKKRKTWRKMDSKSVKDFPRLDLQTIINTITFGEYQVKQGLSYIHEN